MGSVMGGPSDQQKQAATNTLSNAGQLQDLGNKAQAVTTNEISPFYRTRSQTGLPYYDDLVDSASGSTARAFAPAKAALDRRIGSQPGLPSGFREGARADMDEAQAHAFSDNLVGAQAANEQAKQQGTEGLAAANNPLPYYQGSMGGNQSVMNANLRRPGIGGILGGAAGGLASAIPF